MRTNSRTRAQSRIAALIAAAFTAGVGGTGAAAQTAIPPAAPDFAMDAVQSDQYEVEAAEVAVAQSRNPAVRAFAEEMIRDHSRAEETVRQAAVTSGLPPPPPAISSDQASLLAALQSLRGADFDKAYANQQRLAHRQALAVEQSYASDGTDADLRKAAQSDVPMIRRHLEKAEALASAVGSR